MNLTDDIRIGLYNLEPNIINTAMMQVSEYYKSKNIPVEIYEAWKGYRYYSKIYVFSIFDFTYKKDIPPNSVCGGTGFDIKIRLPQEIECVNYDWSLYPHCDYSLIWFSRGCTRNCPFCVVRRKEGNIRPVRPKNLNPNGKYIKVMDNNFFANPKWSEAIDTLKEWNQPCDFQGVDARIMTEEHCHRIMELSHYKSIKFAWDDPKENMIPHIERITNIIKPWRLMCYVLIGFDSTEEQDLYRIERLREMKIAPFVMPYNKYDNYQKNLARYVNHKAEFKSTSWDEYKERKGVLIP